MKKYFAALTTTALISAAPFALATSSTDLTVTGLITPVACTPTFSGGGDIDLGKISSGDLKQDQNTLVGSHPLTLTVNCNAAATFSINPIDNNPGTTIGDWFGLGLTDDGKKLGFFFPKILQANADGAAADPIESNDSGTTWVKADSAQPGYWLSVANTGDTDPIEAQVVTMDFEVETYIARADGLDLTNDVNINGSATFEIVY
jgi:type 1 fimbria pilin